MKRTVFPEHTGRSGSAGSLTRVAGLNAFASLLDYGTRIGITFLITPVVLSGLGVHLFGVWQLLLKLMQYMSAADGRPTQALKWLVARRQESSDLDRNRRCIGSALCIWLLFLPVIAAVGLLLAGVAVRLARIPYEHQEAVRLAFGLLVLNFIVTGFAGIAEAVVRGMNLGYKRMGMAAAVSVVGGALSVAAIRQGAGLVGLAGVQVIIAIAMGALFWQVARKSIPWFGIARPRIAEFRSFFRFSSWYFAWTLVNKVLVSSDVVLLAYLLSTASVTSWVLTGYATTFATEVASLAFAAVMPGLGGCIGKKDFARAAAIRRDLLLCCWLIATTAGAMVLAVNGSMIQLWVGGEQFSGTLTTALMVLVMVQLLFLRADAYLIDLTLEIRPKVFAGLLAVGISIGASLLLVPVYGLPGLCAALLSGRAVLSLVYPTIVRRRLRIARPAGFWSSIRLAVVTSFLLGAAAWIGGIVTIRSWIELGLYILVISPVILAVALWIGLDQRQRRRLTARLTALHPRVQSGQNQAGCTI